MTFVRVRTDVLVDICPPHQLQGATTFDLSAKAPDHLTTAVFAVASTDDINIHYFREGSEVCDLAHVTFACADNKLMWWQPLWKR